MISTMGGTPLYGDWRRRRLTKTDAHLYRPEDGRNGLPACRKRIPREETVVVQQGRPCTGCLVAEITRQR